VNIFFTLSRKDDSATIYNPHDLLILYDASSDSLLGGDVIIKHIRELGL
jgi:hypothetical protein